MEASDDFLSRLRMWLMDWDTIPLSDPRSAEAKRSLELNGIASARLVVAAADGTRGEAGQRDGEG